VFVNLSKSLYDQSVDQSKDLSTSSVNKLTLSVNQSKDLSTSSVNKLTLSVNQSKDLSTSSINKLILSVDQSKVNSLTISVNSPKTSLRSIMSEILYLKQLQIGEQVELYTILKNNKQYVTKRTKIGNNGFVCPRFLREIAYLQKIKNPPKYLENHPGYQHVIKIEEVFIEDDYLHFNLEVGDGNLRDFCKLYDLNMFKEKILIDISYGLQYLHDLDLNHQDISFNNIVYFNTLNGIPKFCLIDLGNSVHKNRPLSMEISTICTMSFEFAKFTTILSNIEKIIVERNFTKPNEEYIIKGIEFIRKNFIHRKSDIWSIGALSYLLHNYEDYSKGDTLEKHLQYLNEKNSVGINIENGNPEFISKTELMLSNNQNKRPIMYYSKNLNDNNYDDNNDNCDNNDNKINDADYKLYHVIITNIIETVALMNKKKFFINFIDKSTKSSIINQCYKIEKNIINDILTDIKNKYYLKKECSIVNILCVIRVIIVWLVSHMYMKCVWSFNEISTYISRNHMINKNRIELYDLLKKLSITILQKINWNLDLFT
jgi:hypothetical protein